MRSIGVRIMQGDVIERLRDLPDESVNCVVTSPPYWGLRDYGIDGQVGLEPSLPEHLQKMVNVFREVRRVLRNDGTCWVNYGDCYATTPNGRKSKDILGDDRGFVDKPFSTIGNGLKPKDLCMVPNRLAIALQDDGWWVRSEIIWSKPNPMPDSAGSRDRPSVAHEKIFLLTKSKKYFYDPIAVRQPAKDSSVKRWAQNLELQKGSDRANGGAKTNGPMKAVGGPSYRGRDTYGRHTLEDNLPAGEKRDKQRGHSRRHAGFNDHWDGMSKEEQQANGANLRNVWTIATRPSGFEHFAAFPVEIPLTCIKAGCPKGGIVLDPFGGTGVTAQAGANIE